MRLTVAWIIFVGFLAFGFAQNDDTILHFALSSNCHLFISKTVPSLQAFIKETRITSTPEFDCTNAYVAYAPPTSETSLFVFLPKSKNQIYVYGRTFVQSTEDVFVDVREQFELVDYSKFMQTSCEFDLNGDFMAFFDRNHLYLKLQCPQQNAFMVTQAVSYLKTVWTPDVEFLQLRSTVEYEGLGYKKVAAFPAQQHNSIDEIDSGVVHYGFEDTKLKAYIAPFHQLRRKIEENYKIEKTFTEVTGVIKNLYFVHSKLYIVKTDEGFFPFTQNDDSSFNSIFDDFLFTSIVTFEPESKIVFYGNAEPSDVNEFEHWKFRTTYDPTVDERLSDPVDCGYDNLFNDLTQCSKNLKNRLMTHIVMYCLMVFQFIIIMATLAVFTLCIFKQRKRRRRHHEKKRNKNYKKDVVKTEDPLSTTNTNNQSSKN